MDFILDILGKLGFEWKAALFQLLNFLIVFWILKRFAFGPITKALDKRTKLMREGVENAEKANAELVMSKRKAQEMIDEAKVEANKVISASQAQADAAAEKSREKAKKEIELLVAQAKQNIEADKADMKDALRTETVHIVIAAVEKILSDKFDDKQDKTYIENILRSLKQ